MKQAREISVTDASKRGIAGLVADAEQGEDLVVTRHHRPIAAVVSMAKLDELATAADDLRDLALVLARSTADSGRRTSFDDVLAAFGHTRDSLDVVDDAEADD